MFQEMLKGCRYLITPYNPTGIIRSVKKMNDSPMYFIIVYDMEHFIVKRVTDHWYLVDMRVSGNPRGVWCPGAYVDKEFKRRYLDPYMFKNMDGDHIRFSSYEEAIDFLSLYVTMESL